MKYIDTKIFKYVMTIVVAFMLVGCKHPYINDMKGSFPYMEITSPSKVDFPSNGSQQELSSKITVMSNSYLKTDIIYESYSGHSDWIYNVKVTPVNDGSLFEITFSVLRNKNMDSRSATLKILSEDGFSAQSLRITQAAHTFGEEEICEGDLILRTQSDVDECIYTKVNGRLIIGDVHDAGYANSFVDNSLYFFASDIVNLDRLSLIESADAIIMVANSNLIDFRGLENISTDYIEVSQMPVEGIFYYSGPAQQIIINAVTSELFHCEFASRIPELRSLRIRHTALNDIQDLINCPNLTYLDVSYNNVRDIEVLAGMKNLDTAILSGNDISRTQINYINAANPSLDIIAEDIYGDTRLSLAQSEVTSGSAAFNAETYINNYVSEIGYILLRKDTEFNFNYRTSLYDIVDMSSFAFTLSGLQSLTEYVTYVYMIDSEGRKHLSEPCKFMTTALQKGILTINALYPAYVNSEETADLTSLTGCIFKHQVGSISSESINFVKGTGNSWTYEMPYGVADMLITNSKETNMGVSSTSDNKALWHIEMPSPAGFPSEVLAATLYRDITSDVVENVSLNRLTAKTDIDVTIEGGVLNMINTITINLGNLARNAELSSTYAAPVYSGNALCSFRKKIDNADSIQKIASGVHIFPHGEGQQAIAEVSVALKDGKTLASQVVLPEPVVANTVCNLSFTIKLKTVNSQFTIDKIEVVEDQIEF